MSKASRWARQGRRAMRFRERMTRHDRRRRLVPFVVEVKRNGDLWIDPPEGVQTLRPSEALRLARWILDTFGEEKT